MEDKNLLEEMVKNMDDTEKFFFGLIALLLLEPQVTEELEKQIEKRVV